MIQKSNIWKKNSLWLVANIFFIEPATSHYLKEISKKCNLAHTAVKQHLNNNNSLLNKKKREENVTFQYTTQTTISKYSNFIKK